LSGRKGRAEQKRRVRVINYIRRKARKQGKERGM